MTYYFTLITSLPRHDRQFKVKQTPLSRIQLEKRLKLLTQAEQHCLNDLVHLVWTSWFALDLPISVTLTKMKTLLALRNPFMDDIVHWFLDIRSLFVALRLRKVQSSPPTNPQDYWYTRWSMRLLTNWDKPDFGLRYVYPWLMDVNTKFSNNDTDDVEDILLTQIWHHLNVIEAKHYFDFEALMIYLLRWNIVNYWSQFNKAKARQRIMALSDQMMAESALEKTKGQI
jgi:hypothetical protein